MENFCFQKNSRELLLVLTNLGQAPISLHYLSIQLREVFVKIFAKRKGDYLTAAAAANEAKHLMKLYFWLFLAAFAKKLHECFLKGSKFLGRLIASNRFPVRHLNCLDKLIWRCLMSSVE